MVLVRRRVFSGLTWKVKRGENCKARGRPLELVSWEVPKLGTVKTLKS